jgi:hypothetical protein
MPNDDDFWNSLTLGQQSRTASALDDYLSSKEEEVRGKGLRALTDRGRAANALLVPAEAGTRVAFVTNIGSVLSYPEPPAPDTEGTVVMVRTAEGDQTGLGGMVFVKFDTGEFMAIHPEHLRRAAPNTKRASNFALRVSNLGDLSGFLRWGTDGDNELVHKATKDLWSFESTPEGEFVISRLFDDTGSPIQV